MFSDSENDDDQYAFESDEETRRRVQALQRAQAEQAATAAQRPAGEQPAAFGGESLSAHHLAVVAVGKHAYKQRPVLWINSRYYKMAYVCERRCELDRGAPRRPQALQRGSWTEQLRGMRRACGATGRAGRRPRRRPTRQNSQQLGAPNLCAKETGYEGWAFAPFPVTSLRLSFKLQRLSSRNAYQRHNLALLACCSHAQPTCTHT